MAKQLNFPNFVGAGTKEFGGSLLKGNPRVARPVTTKKPMHLVFRSSLAKGKQSFLRNREIDQLVYGLAKKLNVRIYRYANSGNHLHLIILPKTREAFRNFVRALSGIIARIILGVERGRAKKIKFWDARPYTRILEWGREFRDVCDYVKLNTLEALGFLAISRKPSSQ